jgi:tetratricopeptide (TPR) repeat protein
MEDVLNQFDLLHKRLAGLMVKRPGMALGLWGDPGIGKSFLTQRLLRATPVRGFSLHATAPLTELVAVLPWPIRLPAWASRLMERLEGGEVVEASSIPDALAAVLSGLAPVILHLEDAHEASPERMALIQALAQAVGRSRGVGLLVTSRVLLPEPFESYRLEALGAEGTKQLLESEAGASLPSDAVAWIHGRAQGNPLFTIEHFRYLARQGYLWNDGRRWYWRSPPQDFVPASVEALIERALREASGAPGLRAVLGARALLPPGATDSLWAEVAGVSLEGLYAARADLERYGLMVRNEFVHPLYRELMVQELLPGERQVFAGRAFNALQTDPEAAAAFIEMAGIEPMRAFEVFQRAAAQARQAGNPVQAARFLARAVEYVSGEERAHLALEAARALQNTDLRESARLFMVALDTGLQDEAVIVAAAECQAQLRNLDAAMRTLERLPAGAKDSPTHLVYLLSVRVLGGDLAGALELWRAHPELETSGDLRAASRLVGLLSLTGHLVDAVRVSEHALQTPNLTVDHEITVRANLAAALFYQGRIEEAQQVWARAVTVCAEHGFERQRAVTLINWSQARIRVGKLESVASDLREAGRVLLEMDDLRLYASAQVMLGDVLTRQAEYDRAEEALLEARSLLEANVSLPLVNAELALSNLYVEWGASHAAYLAPRHARQALRAARTLGNAMMITTTLSALAYAEAMAGEADLALGHASEALEQANKLGQPMLRVGAFNARGTALRGLGKQESALEAFREALTVAEASGLEEPAWQMRLEIAHLNDDLEGARACLDWFLSRGLMHSVRMIHRWFPQFEAVQKAVPVKEPPVQSVVQCLGVMQVVRDGQPVALRGRKRQELLARLLEARISGRAELSRLDLIDAMYPDADETQATTSLKDVVHQVRSSLGQSVIQTTSNGYALGVVTSDAEAFLAGGDTRLWRGGYLQGLELDRLDETVREALSLALRSRVRVLHETDPKEAARLARILLESEPYDREVLGLCLGALRLSGNHRSLTRLYDDARTRFEEVGESLPDDWKQFLASA